MSIAMSEYNHCSGVSALRIAAHAARGPGMATGAPHCHGCSQTDVAIEALFQIYAIVSTGQQASARAGKALVQLGVLKEDEEAE